MSANINKYFWLEQIFETKTKGFKMDIEVYLGVSVRELTAASNHGSPSSPCSTSNLVAPSAINLGLWQIS